MIIPLQIDILIIILDDNIIIFFLRVTDEEVKRTKVFVPGETFNPDKGKESTLERCSTQIGCGLTHNCSTKIERLVSDKHVKHSSLPELISVFITLTKLSQSFYGCY
jgi:hypothetical protein